MTLLLPAYNKLIGGADRFEAVELGGAHSSAASYTIPSVNVPSGYDVYVAVDSLRFVTGVTVGADSAVRIFDSGDLDIFAVSSAPGGTVDISISHSLTGNNSAMLAIALSNSFGDAESPTATKFSEGAGSLANPTSRELALFLANNTSNTSPPSLTGATEVFSYIGDFLNISLSLGYQYPAGDPAAFTSDFALESAVILI